MPTMSHQNIANGLAVPSAESVIATSPVNNVDPVRTVKVVIRATLNMLAGTGTTAIVLRIRQGSTVAGTVLGTATVTLAAGANGGSPISVEDTPAWLSAPANGGQYSLTVAQTGGSANGTVNVGDLQVEALP
jgi:hypothetical protein